MSEKLQHQQCQPCSGDAPHASQAEREEYLAQLPGWEIIQVGGADKLKKTFKFDGYPPCLDFVREVGNLAESADHHPEMTIEWGKVTVIWWTHTINGLHRNDFIMAARTEEACDSD